MTDPVVIVSVSRTPIGHFLGELLSLSATALGAIAIRAAVSRSGLDPARVDEVLMGNCLMAGLGQAPARQAALGAGLPASVGAVTLSKMCGSGLRAVMFAQDMLLAGSAEIVVAGGMESMSNAPHLIPMRKGVRYGSGTLLDHMALDGLEDAYEPGRAMGHFAQDCADQHHLSRQQQDAFAATSVERARQAQELGLFTWEMVPVTLQGKGNTKRIECDEHPSKVKLDQLAQLPPIFKPDGTITAASSSSISDGAAAMVLMRLSSAQACGIQPLARVVASAIHAQQPAQFATAPASAVRKTLHKAGWVAEQVDLWEINEAFAAVTLVAMADLKLSHERVNVHGGACALGHPIGASGARILVSLIGALRHRSLRTGIAVLCIGGGEAAALALEVM